MTIFEAIESCFFEIKTEVGAEFLQKFVLCDYKDLCRYHFGLGSWIRDHLLGKKTHLYKFFQAGGIKEKDDMSALIIQLLYLHLHMNPPSSD